MPTEYFEQRERALLGSRYEELYAPPAAQAARGVTVSPLRMSPADFAAGAGFAVTPSPFCGAGFLVQEEDFKPGRHPWHHAGVFYSQEPSASSAAPLLGVRPGMRVLDLCAAPGGKTSQLAAALAGEGLLIANEYVAARAEILKSNLERMGVANAVVLNESPERIAAALPEFFDRILVDAPCSGEGMFRKEPAALAQHSEALVAQCAALGSSILDSAAAALAPGGEIVYSTCTFAPEEDEGQVAAFLARHPEFALADVMERAFAPFGSPGEENRTGGLPLDVSLVRRIWPCQGGEGHFMARLVKAGTTDPARRAAEEAVWLARLQKPQPDRKSSAPKGKNRTPAGRNPRGGKPESVPAGQMLAAWKDFAARFFPALADKPAVVLGESVLLPPVCPALGLHILRAGVLAGTVQKGRFVPGHHLFTAFGKECVNTEALTRSDPRCRAYLLGQEIEAASAKDGWCCVTVDGCPLGGGKVSGGRVKNHYPKALRLLG